jgi:hypothetical protein
MSTSINIGVMKDRSEKITIKQKTIENKGADKYIVVYEIKRRLLILVVGI